MGTYCELYIADYPVFSCSSRVFPIVMTFFREKDKKIFKRRFNDRNEVEWNHAMSEGGQDIETAIEYRASSKHVRQRLDIMGFTLQRVINEFEKAKSEEIEKLKEWAEEDEHNIWGKDILILENSSFENYMEAFQKIITSGTHPVHYLESFPKSSQLIQYILNEKEEFYWGFPCFDIRCFFRALIEIAPDESFVTQDITDLVHAGYYEKNERVCELAHHALNGDYPTNSKIIILTEGTTDTEILEPSLKLLYPHLSEYYSFMDFGMRPSGGVGPLVNAVKSFAGSGIVNKIIALFDNDTAAFSAVESLKQINIPNNIVITHYPDIELANNYPALGPSGLHHQNINELACGIELYCGIDILSQDGELTPIRWKGFDDRLKRYQGEILHKNEIKRTFLAKLGDCQENPSNIQKSDWSGIDQIFQHIFQAFNDKNYQMN